MSCRVDIYLTDLLRDYKGKSEFSRVEIQNFIKKGFVSVNNKIIIKPSFAVFDGCNIKVDKKKIDDYLKNKIQENTLKPKDIDIKIVFENENLIVIDKQIDLTVHPGAGNKNNTLVNGLLALQKSRKISFSNERGDMRLGIVHRLDKNTSGLMIIAKNNKEHRLLSEMLKNHEIDRRYLALCHGVPIPSHGRIENYICRDSKNIQKMKLCNIDDRGAKYAITNYKVIKTLDSGKYSIVECKLETGRTHQIRLHMQSIKHPLVGEQIYITKNLIMEDKNKNFFHQMLHSYRLKFNDPINGELIDIELLNEDFKQLMKD